MTSRSPWEESQPVSSGRDPLCRAGPRPQTLAKIWRSVRVALVDSYPDGAYCKQLARATRTSRRTMSRWLHWLVKAGLLDSPIDGLYRVRPGAPDLALDVRGIPGVHGLVLVSREWPAEPLRAALGQRFGHDLTAPGAPERSRNDVFNGRPVRFCYHPGTAQIRVEIPAKPTPLHPEELGELLGWLNAFFSPLDAGGLWVVEIGVHVDYPDVQVKGFTALQLRPCVEALLQIYRKTAHLLRREVHLYPASLDLRQAIEMLWSGSAAAQVRRSLELELEIRKILAETLRSVTYKLPDPSQWAPGRPGAAS
jgi:hypothetical protein